MMVLREKKRAYRLELIIMMHSSECYFSKLEHVAHYKAKNQTVKNKLPLARRGITASGKRRQKTMHVCKTMID